MRPDRVLITGATGFIGRPTCEVLAARGFEVHRVSRESRRWPGGAWHRFDLLRDDPQPLIDIVKPDIIVHAAWVAPPADYRTHPDNLLWAERTRRLARAARDARVPRQVFVGTSMEHAPPATAYAGAKLALRYALEDDLDGTSWAWARPFLVYGPGEAGNRLIPSVCRALAQGRPALCGSGEAVRDLVHVEDVAHALATLAGVSWEGDVDVGTGRAVRIADVARRLGKLAGRKDLIRLGDTPLRDEPARLVADTRPLRALDALPRISLEVGLAEALSLHRRQERAA